MRTRGEILRHCNGDWPEPAATPATADQSQSLSLPAWALHPAPEIAPAPKLLSPSDLGGEKALFGEGGAGDEEDAKRHGRNLHRLLEHLPLRPRAQWPETARILLSQGEDALLPDEIEPVLAEAQTVLDAPGMADWLGSDTLAEVEITAEIAELGARIHGFIDRMRIGPDGIELLDYKSNRIVPERPVDVPDGIVKQMAAYRAALRQIHPGQPIRCSILWTRSGAIMPLTDAQLDAALRTPPVS